MKAAALFAVLAGAKLAAVGPRELLASPWSPAAFLWQDAVVALVFGAIERALVRQGRLLWTAYAALTGYVALTVPVLRVLSTPLTWPMWRAAGGPLADSIAYYATPANITWIVALLAAAAAMPFAARRIRPAALAACLVPLVALGPTAASRVDTRGLDRNAWSVLVTSARPAGAIESGADWRAPRTTWQIDDLGYLRGAAGGRHVILVSLESTAAQYLGLYGATPDTMPNLSALARSAVVFEHAYAVYPESIKGLFATLCSMYPAFDRDAEIYAHVPCRSPAQELAARGYRTALFHSGRFDYLGMNAVIRDRGFALLADAGDIGGERESSFGVDEMSTVSRMLDWVDARAPGERFFLTYLPIAGHHPYATAMPGQPGPFPDASERDRYRNALHEGDAALGRLVDGIRERGLERDVLWIVFGDHGEAFGQHAGNYGHTFNLYEENVHVPFLVAAPGLIPRQVRSRRVVSLLDTAPTLLDLVGIPVPETYEGRSALDGEPRAALFFADYSLGLLGLRDGPLKFIHEIDSGRPKLFDVERDPLETHNLAAQHRDSVAEYALRLKRWSAAQTASIDSHQLQRHDATEPQSHRENPQRRPAIGSSTARAK